MHEYAAPETQRAVFGDRRRPKIIFQISAVIQENAFFAPRLRAFLKNHFLKISLFDDTLSLDIGKGLIKKSSFFKNFLRAKKRAKFVQNLCKTVEKVLKTVCRRSAKNFGFSIFSMFFKSGF